MCFSTKTNGKLIVKSAPCPEPTAKRLPVRPDRMLTYIVKYAVDTINMLGAMKIQVEYVVKPPG
jgi:hypothetical protein